MEAVSRGISWAARAFAARVDCARGEARRPSRRNLVDETTRPFLQDQCCGVSDSFCILNSGFPYGSAYTIEISRPGFCEALGPISAHILIRKGNSRAFLHAGFQCSKAYFLPEQLRSFFQLFLCQARTRSMLRDVVRQTSKCLFV